MGQEKKIKGYGILGADIWDILIEAKETENTQFGGYGIFV